MDKTKFYTNELVSMN